jgi:hypothetical protein
MRFGVMALLAVSALTALGAIAGLVWLARGHL